MGCGYARRRGKDENVGMRRSVGKKVCTALRWSGVLVCAALALGWVLSGWYKGKWIGSHYTGRGVYSLGLEISEGGLRMHWWGDGQGMSGAIGFFDGSSWGRIQGAPSWHLWFEHEDVLGRGPVTHHLWFVPLWAPLLLCGPPTVVLWRRRCIRAGFCSCVYARAGLPESAACPECGRVFSSARR